MLGRLVLFHSLGVLLRLKRVPRLVVMLIKGLQLLAFDSGPSVPIVDDRGPALLTLDNQRLGLLIDDSELHVPTVLILRLFTMLRPYLLVMDDILANGHVENPSQHAAVGDALGNSRGEHMDGVDSGADVQGEEEEEREKGESDET